MSTIVDAALNASGMKKTDADRVRAHVATTHLVVYGGDWMAGHCCPLLASGFKRTVHGGWDATGASRFMEAYDRAMQRHVGLRGPACVSVREDD